MPDIHVPYQDEKAVGATLEFAKYFKPETIIFLGDLFDCETLSRYIQDPENQHKFQEELDAGRALLASFRKVAPNATIKYLKGNHEDRLRKFMWSQAKMFNSLRALKWPKLLELEELGIEWVESGHILMHGLLVKHGNIVRQHAGYSARAEMEKNGISGISGHTHRLAQVFKKDFGGEWTWVEAGCLCRTKDVKWLEGQMANWQNGVAVGFLKKDSGRFSVSPIPIVQGKLLFDLREFSA